METLDLETIRRATQGDPEAFAGIYRVYSRMVYGVALRMTGRPEEAEDVTQEVFVRVYRSLRWFAGRSSLKTWIYRIAINQSLSQIRRRSRRKEAVLAPEMDVPDPAGGTREQVVEAETLGRLTRSLEAVDPVFRSCLILRAQEGMSYEEIARTLGIPVNTVRTRIRRGREQALAAYRREADHDM
ncbi:MAG: sigma-70 family RNA polymerase sigma factor [Elusimicrobia bacterium]|nr:sigma-70 family RNA polymerase sigma factor [Elusimicrobiota bacterium]